MRRPSVADRPSNPTNREQFRPEENHDPTPRRNHRCVRDAHDRRVLRGPDGAFDFWKLDDAFEQFSNQQLDDFDVIVFGRRTYDGMAEYWPTPDAVEHSPEMAQRMNDTAKLVVSTTLSSPTWQATTAVPSVDKLDCLRRQSGASMLVLGSPSLVGSLIERSMLDELRVMVNPVATGCGAAFADAVAQHVECSLADVRRIGADNVLLTYTTR